MTLATADKSGQPHSRIILLKELDDTGFIWYTSQASDKGQQLAKNPQACLLFYWRELERQVRLEGYVEKLGPTQAEQYFQSRPQGSKFSAAASQQSTRIDNREVLEKRVKSLMHQYPDGNVPRPESWGGYRLNPHRFEFWQGRADRLHDRFIYTQSKDKSTWTIDRVSP